MKVGGKRSLIALCIVLFSSNLIANGGPLRRIGRELNLQQPQAWVPKTKPFCESRIQASIDRLATKDSLPARAMPIKQVAAISFATLCIFLNHL